MIVCIPKECKYKLQKDYTIRVYDDYRFSKLVPLFLKLIKVRGWSWKSIPPIHIQVDLANKEYIEFTLPTGLVVEFSNHRGVPKYKTFKKYNKDLNFSFSGTIWHDLNGAKLEEYDV